jgi:hypothetical protein
VDGLRNRYTYPSSPDQGAFHEGIADVVALLSIFALPQIVEALLDKDNPGATIRRSELTREKLRASVLLGLAEQMGEEMQMVRGRALRQSATLARSPRWLDDPNYQEPHNRGEILVAAMLNTFIDAWRKQLEDVDDVQKGRLDRKKVVQEGADAADRLLTMSIRALDYTPTVDLQFGDYLSALLTADLRVKPDDGRYGYRALLRDTFLAYGIKPTARGSDQEPGIWAQPEEEPDYTGTHFESLQHEPSEAFRFLWQNRRKLRVDADPYTRVLSVRPTIREGQDGFLVHETVAEYMQIVIVRASELSAFKLKKPNRMAMDTPVHLYGGGALIFDEYGRLIYHVRNRLMDPPRQQRRLDYLWETGAFDKEIPEGLQFAEVHRLRGFDHPETYEEVW